MSAESKQPKVIKLLRFCVNSRFKKVRLQFFPWVSSTKIVLLREHVSCVLMCCLCIYTYLVPTMLRDTAKLGEGEEHRFSSCDCADRQDGTVNDDGAIRFLHSWFIGFFHRRPGFFYS